MEWVRATQKELVRARSVHPSIFHFNAKSVLSGAEMKRIEQEARVVLPAGYRYEFQALVVTKW